MIKSEVCTDKFMNCIYLLEKAHVRFYKNISNKFSNEPYKKLDFPFSHYIYLIGRSPHKTCIDDIIHQGERTNLSYGMNKLETLGLVESIIPETDRRMKLFSLTKEGKVAYKIITTEMDKQAKAFDSDIESLYNLLAKMSNSLIINPNT
jgi:DNA-binding MarR family transcriptional regulator